MLRAHTKLADRHNSVLCWTGPRDRLLAGDFPEDQLQKPLIPFLNSKKVSQLRVAMSLVSLLNAHLAFAFDGEATLKALRDSSKDTRRRALESPELAVCYSSEADDTNCPTNPELFKRINNELIRLLKDPDPSIRRVAAQYLTVSTDARATESLARLLRDSDEEVRRAATSAFVHITVRDPVIVKDPERLLEDHNKFVRMNAAMGLIWSGTRHSLIALRAAYNREVEPDVKELFAEAVRDLGKKIR